MLEKRGANYRRGWLLNANTIEGERFCLWWFSKTVTATNNSRSVRKTVTNNKRKNEQKKKRMTMAFIWFSANAAMAVHDWKKEFFSRCMHSRGRYHMLLLVFSQKVPSLILSFFFFPKLKKMSHLEVFDACSIQIVQIFFLSLNIAILSVEFLVATACVRVDGWRSLRFV